MANMALKCDVFPEVIKDVRRMKISIKTKKSVLKCFVISVLFYGSEGWTIFSNEGTEMF